MSAPTNLARKLLIRIFIELFGGAPSSLLGQLILRDDTKKLVSKYFAHYMVPDIIINIIG